MGEHGGSRGLTPARSGFRFIVETRINFKLSEARRRGWGGVGGQEGNFGQERGGGRRRHVLAGQAGAWRAGATRTPRGNRPRPFSRHRAGTRSPGRCTGTERPRPPPAPPPGEPELCPLSGSNREPLRAPPPPPSRRGWGRGGDTAAAREARAGAARPGMPRAPPRRPWRGAAPPTASRRALRRPRPVP